VTTTVGAVVGGGSSTTTPIPPATGTSPPTVAPLPLDPPPVEALAKGEAVPDPVPRVIAFVIDPGNEMVVLGTLSTEQVRQLFQELTDRRLPHTGTATGGIVFGALLALLVGGALLGLSRWGRDRVRGDRTA
jgi:LPXTG-motif cell wall-anchored protein